MSRTPWLSSFFAEGELGFLVRARSSNDFEEAWSAFITAPPCLPVAPVTRTLVTDIAEVFVGFTGLFGDGLKTESESFYTHSGPQTWADER